MNVSILTHLVWYLLCIVLKRCFAASDQQELFLDMGTRQISHIAVVEANSSLIIHATDVPQEISSVMFQVHSQKSNVTLSKLKEIALHSSITGTNVGLTGMLTSEQSSVKMWVYNNNNRNATVLIIITSYNGDDPVPGGCNMEFPVDISPFLHLYYDDIITKLEYQHANIGYPRKARPPSCSRTMSQLSYEIYVFFLDENSFREDAYFRGIQEMSNTTSIYKVAKKAKTYTLHPGTRTAFYTYPNVGVIYNVIAQYQVKGVVKETSYVPIASYGCKLVSEEYGCFYSASVIPRPVFLILTLYAAFQIFFGHMYFNGEMFFFGFLAFSFVGYILLAKYASLSETVRYVSAASVGVLGGLFWIGVWNLLGRPVVSLLLVGFVLGFLLSCTAMYSPLGSFDIFTNDKNYWLSLGCGTLLIAALLLPFPKVLSIVATSVVGSFVAIVSYEQDLRGSLPYIIINVVKRALRSGLSVADNEYPFEKTEIISSSVWGGLSLLGILVQYCLQRRHPDFPKPYRSTCCCPRFYYMCNCHNQQFGPSRIIYTDNTDYPNERQPLLLGGAHQNSSCYDSIPSESDHGYVTPNHNQSVYSSAISHSRQCNSSESTSPVFFNSNEIADQRAPLHIMRPPPPYSEH